MLVFKWMQGQMNTSLEYSQRCKTEKEIWGVSYVDGVASC